MFYIYKKNKYIYILGWVISQLITRCPHPVTKLPKHLFICCDSATYKKRIEWAKCWVYSGYQYHLELDKHQQTYLDWIPILGPTLGIRVQCVQSQRDMGRLHGEERLAITSEKDLGRCQRPVLPKENG